MEFYAKWAGAFLLAVSGMLAGLGASHEYVRRVREIEAMILCLNRMRAEIELRLTPMNDIFHTLSILPGPCAAFFRALAAALEKGGGETLENLWRRAAEENFRPCAARDILAELGASLGCFDAGEECGAIAYAAGRLETELEQARRDNATQGVLRRRLGAAAGIGLAILFL